MKNHRLCLHSINAIIWFVGHLRGKGHFVSTKTKKKKEIKTMKKKNMFYEWMSFQLGLIDRNNLSS